MNKKQKQALIWIIISAVLYIVIAVMAYIDVYEKAAYGQIWLLVSYLIPYLIVGGKTILRAVKNICHGQVFDENLLMCIATFGALGIGEYSEAVAVMLFYQIGELFESYAVNRSRQSIADLMNICPEYANIEKDGRLEKVAPDDVEIGQIIVIKPGERIPLDGVITSGKSTVDTSALTGEAVPRTVQEGTEIISGCVNLSGVIYVRITKIFDDCTVAKILELVENASSKKAKVENFITKFARYYTPVVVSCAIMLAILPPIFLGEWADWIKRACIFLVISCPCALVVSVPLSFFGGIGAASKVGVLVKGSNFLEALAEMTTIVFDKTGTLTKGEFKVNQIAPVGINEEALLEYAALAEGYVDHPIAKSIKEAYGKALNLDRVTATKESSGRGICVTVDGSEVLVGNEKLMMEKGISYLPSSLVGTHVYLAKDGIFIGSIVISDTIKEDAKEAITSLKRENVTKTVMLTGDKKSVGEAVSKEIGIDYFFAELLPADKVEKVEALLKEQGPKERLAFVGDGINDAPVLSRADIGIAMGSMGSDAAIEAADIVLMDDQPSKIATVVQIARRTMKIVRQNIIFALGVKIIVLAMGALGVANMWEAVFADVGVLVIAILNAMRTLQIKK